MRKVKKIPAKKRVPVDNRAKMKPLRVIEDKDPSKEDIEKVPTLNPFFSKHRFFTTKKKQSAEEATQEEEAITLDPGEPHESGLTQFFRKTRFFKNPDQRAKPDETKINVEEDNQEREEDEENEIKLEPSHPSDGKSGKPEVSELLNAKDEWIDLEDAWGDERKIPPIGWFAMVALLILCSGGWAIYQVSLAQPKLQEIVIDNQTFLEAVEKEDQEVKALDTNLQDCIKGYLAATSITDILPYVRFPERVKPLMQDYYQKNARKIPVFRHIERMRSLNIGKRSFVSVQVRLESGKDYHMLIEQVGENTFKVDWESDVFYQPMRWADYCDKKPLKPMDFRVKVTPDHYYGYAFRDKKKYQCYKISTLGSERFLYGYVERETEVAYKLQDYFEKYGSAETISTTSKDEEKMEKVEEPPEILNIVSQLGKNTIGKKGKNMILRMSFLLEDSSMNCLKIEDLVCVGWAYIEPTDALFTEQE
jgi:hypothetical protein